MTDTSLYFFKAVQWASEQGLVEGETFDPYAGCTRAMAVYFMWVAADSPEAAAASFTDVAADADYAAAVNWAVAQGVTLGTGPPTLLPERQKSDLLKSQNNSRRERSLRLLSICLTGPAGCTPE